MLEAMKQSLENLSKAEPKQFKKKLDKVLEVLGLTNIQCNRIYDTDLTLLLISSSEKGEEPQILVVRTMNEKRGEEIQLVYLGKHHVEDLTYFKSNPKNWNAKRFGYSVLTPIQAKKLGDILSQVKTEFEILEYVLSMPANIYCWNTEAT